MGMAVEWHLAKCIAKLESSKVIKHLNATSNKGITTRSKDATSSSWHRY